ncbi:O-antigen polymerase [Oceanisphaera litoralis]|uniref:PglL family O-oligosaccharyltransferase n=1 Tax=Oceanisphaera litoralis TaxID=225144 RepID=UPI00195A6FA9|nr:Wzy polymerase domain-containing protein [Oceanisphaera litoralis]MBM7455551.1 O-antigen polymerase [Oceanisphaera litoralis]
MSLPYLWFWCFAAWSLGGMHYFMHNPGGSGFYLPFNMVGWIFISLMTGLGLWQMTLNRSVSYSRFHLWCWLVLLLLLVPLLYPNRGFADHALPRLAGLAGGLLFWFGLLQCRLNETARYRLLYLLLAAVSLEALLGLTQYYLLTPGNWIGYNTDTNRPYGIFQQPNVMASFMATGLILACYLGLADTRRLPVVRQFWLGAVLVTSSLLLTVLQSRVGLLGGLIGLVLLLPWAWQQKPKYCLWGLGLIGLGIAIGLTSMALVEGVQRGADIYTDPGIRTQIWLQSLALITEHPWFGAGYGDFERQFMEFYGSQRALLPELPMMPPNLDHPHNELLYWGVEGGLLPVLAIISVALAFVRLLFKAPWRHALALAALIWPIALHSQTEYPFYHSLAHWVTLLVLLYWIDTRLEAPHSRPYRPWLLARFAALLIPALVVPFMLTGLQTARVVTQYERGGGKEPELLLSASNPLAWLTRLEFNAMSLRLAVGSAQQNTEELQAYVDWGRQFVRHTPRANIYYNMALALNRLDRPQEADALLQQARYFYPDDATLQQDNISQTLQTLNQGPASQAGNTARVTAAEEP